jgi:hypothetical protein
MFVLKVAQALKEANVRFAIAGGYAVALHGALRGTLDLDLVLRLDRQNFVEAAGALRRLRLEPRLPATAEEVFDFRGEYLKHRALRQWDFHDAEDPSQRVDILLAHDLRTLRVDRLRCGDAELPVVSRADLVAMKRASGRPQDLEDARALELLAS